MSWFNRSGQLRSSLRRSASPSLPKELDANACLESFKMHWQQVLEIINKQGPQTKFAKADNIRAVMNHFDQMVTLLLHEVEISGNAMGPILDYLLIEDILDQLFAWSTKTGENINALKIEQLKLYEVLVSHSQQPLLIHKPILNPLLKLLQICSECGPVEVEKRLVILLNQLCVSLTQDATLMEFFFSVSLQQGPSRFLIFNLLIPFVHREGGIGQQARDALLLCMSLSRENDGLGSYIAQHSNFCPILATGLSGLYSLLPRKLIIQSEDWHRLTPDDIHDIPELAMFMNSFEFCNAVIQVSYPLVQVQLLEYLYQGFLVPVLGPALHQDNVGLPIENIDWPEYSSSSADEIITATTYLDLFLRSITEPALLQVFLRFIFKEPYDGSLIIDTIISRIGIQSRLCLVTLALFRTLLELNCEDVMFHLVLRYLIPCTHVMVSQRCRIKDFDIYCKTAEKFLALIPACCQPEVADDDQIASGRESQPQQAHGSHKRSFTVPEMSIHHMPQLDSESYQTSYLDYLQEARRGIRNCLISCSFWTYPYDGNTPSPEQYKIYLTHKDDQKINSFKDKNHKDKKDCSLEPSYNCLNHEDANPNPDEDGPKFVFVADKDKSSQSSDKCLSSTEDEETPAECMDSSNKKIEPKAEAQEISLEIEAKNSAHFTENENSGLEAKEFAETLNSETNDQMFWTMLQRCRTPPLTNIEDSIHEIESMLGLIETKYIKPYSSNSVSRVEVNSETSRNYKFEKCLDSSDTVYTTESRIPILKSFETRSASLESQDKPLLHQSFQGYTESFGNPDTGPFLSMLFNKLENMMNNNLYINLQLTGVIARLAYFPQPLLRSFLLNHTLVFQPTVRSLLQILGSLKHKLDNYSSTVDNFHNLLGRARKFLRARDERLLLDSGMLRCSEPGRRRSSSPDSQRENKRRSLTDFLFRRPTITDRDKQINKDITLDGIPDGTGYRYINRPFPDAPDGKLESLKTKNAVLCAVVLEEFLKEMSAITQEHSVAELDEFNFDNCFTESLDSNKK